jgi:enterochelin esterase-like enzyme
VGITSAVTVAVAAGLVLALSLATTLLWGPLGTTGIARWPLRGALLLAGQLSAVMLAGFILNRIYDFYVSWPELFGQHVRFSAAQPDVGSLDAQLAPELGRAYRTGHGILVPLPIAGYASGVRGLPAEVYLPPQYGDPSYASRTFPVVELLAGFPGSPATWTNVLHVTSTLDKEIAAGRSAPFIAVMPTMNIGKPRDAECVNVVNGPQIDTFLTDDVRTAVQHAFRASAESQQWALMGYSTGGYCAANLAMRHPDKFPVAVSIAGYNAAVHDATTGDLFGHSQLIRDLNSPLWREQHMPAPVLDLLLIATKQDLIANYENQILAQAARSPLRIWTLTLPKGGHNAATFVAELPAAFVWLSHYVAAPLAPIQPVEGRVPGLFTVSASSSHWRLPQTVHPQRAHR